jgi:hypothetical protein
MEEGWLDGYDLDKLNEFQKIYQPIKESEEEQYRPYFEFANSEYENVKCLKKHINFINELLVSNHGHIMFNGIIIPSTLIADGPNKGKGTYPDYYREILFPDFPIKSHIFITYRLIAEAWCDNPCPKKYTIVHHVGNDSYDNKSNLLFVTKTQHIAIKHNRLKKPIQACTSIVIT